MLFFALSLSLLVVPFGGWCILFAPFLYILFVFTYKKKWISHFLICCLWLPRKKTILHLVKPKSSTCLTLSLKFVEEVCLSTKVFPCRVVSFLSVYLVLPSGLLLEAKVAWDLISGNFLERC